METQRRTPARKHRNRNRDRLNDARRVDWRAICAALATVVCCGIETAAYSDDIADEKNISAVVQAEIRTFRDKHDRAPTIEDFLRIVSDESGRSIVLREDRETVWHAFQETQQGIIAKSDLAELHKAVRDSIHDMQLVVQLEQYQYPEGGDPVVTRDVHSFAIAGRKARLQTDTPVANATTRHVVRAYDESVVRLFQREEDAEVGSVAHFDGRAMFYRPESNILFGSMLVDSVDATGMELRFHDLLTFLGDDGVTVFEQMDKFGDFECVVVGDPSTEAWLDLSRNFAVVRFRHYFLPDQGPRRLSYDCILEDLTDCGNGIWLPQKMIRRMYAKDADKEVLLREDIATVTELHVNKGVNDALFTEVIPAGVYVVDGVKNLTYVAGEDGSIQAMLDDVIAAGPATATPRSGLMGWLIAANAMLSVLVLVIYFARRMKTRKEGR